MVVTVCLHLHTLHTTAFKVSFCSHVAPTLHAASSRISSLSPLSSTSSLCYQAKLSPYLSSRGVVADTGSGTSTIIIDPLTLSYTRTIVFLNLSLPTNSSRVHDEQAPLPGFPDNVQEGIYAQTFPTTSFNAYFLKELAKEIVNEYITLSKVDLLHGVYHPCEQPSSTSSSSPLWGKRLRGSSILSVLLECIH